MNYAGLPVLVVRQPGCGRVPGRVFSAAIHPAGSLLLGIWHQPDIDAVVDRGNPVPFVGGDVALLGRVLQLLLAVE